MSVRQRFDAPVRQVAGRDIYNVGSVQESFWDWGRERLLAERAELRRVLRSARLRLWINWPTVGSLLGLLVLALIALLHFTGRVTLVDWTGGAVLAAIVVWHGGCMFALGRVRRPCQKDIQYCQAALDELEQVLRLRRR